MDPLVHEWLNLAIRWAHVMFGIALIGSSLYFMWLDASLEPPDPPRAGVAGEAWSVHGGGFYRVEKFGVAPPALPRRLHWFKWEAGMTFVTGALLLLLVFHYGMGGDVFVEPRLAALGGAGATAFFAALVCLSWLLYDALFRSALGRARPLHAAAIGFAALVVVIWALCRVMQPQAAFVHVGALIGTLMVANVWMIIIPNQRAMVEAVTAGRAPDADRGLQGKIRSTHNSYLTLPVVFMMLSKNFSSTWGSAHAWAILTGLIVIGAIVRHWFLLHDKGRTEEGRWIWPAAIAGAVALFFVARAG
jgi:uncharacterized membrane protein